MKKYLLLFLLGAVLPVYADDATNSMTETIVCIRHGEKPSGGLGQLTIRGLNRSLALPKVLLGKYGKPQYIFAPNPTETVDGKPGYYYIRPIATIEPTAIQCGLPLNTRFGYTEVKDLENELTKTNYQGATVFVAWEHGWLDRFAKNFVADNGGNAQSVPMWRGDEYDMIFVFKLKTANGKRDFSFGVDHEGLNGLSDLYP
jgi:hypothetical protein